jgi:CPA2 family monovalent cation:H+ antiporter-2
MFPLVSSPDAFMALTCVFVLLILALGLFLKRIHQPYIVSYILVGVLMGSDGLGMVENTVQIQHMGEIGIILLLFFIGMEIDLPDFVKQWKVALIGTILQVTFSVGLILGLGHFLGWNTARSVILGFVIALSSSAVIIKLLEEKGLLPTKMGKNVLSILLTQDILIVPMLIITSFMGGRDVPFGEIALMIVGGVLIIGLLAYIYWKKKIKLPYNKLIAKDNELQVFLAIFFCFGGALITSFFGLSAALGAFVGGMVMHAAEESTWLHDTLHSFRILFVAIFFVTVGLQLDLTFIGANLLPVTLLVLGVYLTNHIVNAGILRFFLPNWRQALLAGALLAQIGELSFLVSFSAYQSGILQEYGYQITLATICLTLLISPFYIAVWEKFVKASVE